ncbi:MAG: NYN domain-containing protein [Actinobacteria bacterium]|nr:NYN domain-containing protein [Actinomycetota bacterium]
MDRTDIAEERLALFLDFENVAIGARDVGVKFEMEPLLDALADRGKLLVRRAYADWNLFRDYRRDLVDAHVEMIEIPQRDDSVRKNAADIKMAVDAMELALRGDLVSSFVIVSGDSDFTPLVSKLRELNRRVIGVGLRGSTSALLPPACDEFIFYDRLESVQSRRQAARRSDKPQRQAKAPSKEKSKKSGSRQDLEALGRLVVRTLSGLQQSTTGPVLGSNLKRALLRKDPTFNEADYGFRAFSELLRHLEAEKHIALQEGSAPGDPEVHFAEGGAGEEQAFKLLRETVLDLAGKLGGDPPLSGLKDQLRKRDESFSEKDLGYSGFLQFCKAASAKGFIELEWDEQDEEYYLFVPEEK